MACGLQYEATPAEHNNQRKLPNTKMPGICTVFSSRGLGSEIIVKKNKIQSALN